MMKNFIITTLLFVISLNVSAQNFTDKQFALINYELEITDEFRKDMKPLKKFIKKVEVHNKDTDDKLKALMVHHFYYHLAEQLEKHAEIDIIPINTFMQEVKYDEFGYPKSNISKILRIGDSHFYFKLKILVDSKTEEKKKNDPKLRGDISFPAITIDINVYNDEGIIPVDRWKGTKIAYKPFEVNERFFRTLAKEDQLPPKPKNTENEQESLFELYKMAVDNLIEPHKD
jgi:hypothetical protein